MNGGGGGGGPPIETNVAPNKQNDIPLLCQSDRAHPAGRVGLVIRVHLHPHYAPPPLPGTGVPCLYQAAASGSPTHNQCAYAKTDSGVSAPFAAAWLAEATTRRSKWLSLRFRNTSIQPALQI
jgi:hypothetical protein